MRSSSGVRYAALSIALGLLLVSPVFAQPIPSNYAASYAYNPFYATTPTWEAVAGTTTKTTPVPWAAELVNYIAYNTTGTKSTNVALCTQQATTNECLTLDLYNTVYTSTLIHKGDLVYTDPTGASFLVGHFNFTTGQDVKTPSALWLEQASNGQVFLYDSNRTYVNGFISTPFTVAYVGLSGNVASPSGKNYEATGGYQSLWIGGTAGSVQLTNTVISIVPVVVVVAVLGLVVGMLKKFKL